MVIAYIVLQLIISVVTVMILYYAPRFHKNSGLRDNHWLVICTVSGVLISNPLFWVFLILYSLFSNSYRSLRRRLS